MPLRLEDRILEKLNLLSNDLNQFVKVGIIRKSTFGKIPYAVFSSAREAGHSG